VRIHRYGCSPLFRVVLDVCEPETKRASVSFRTKRIVRDEEELELTMIRELLQGSRRGLDLLVGMSSNFVVGEVRRDLDDPIGVEDDLLTSGGNVVEHLGTKKNKMSLEERKAKREKKKKRREQTSITQVTCDIFPSSSSTATAIPSSWE